MGGVIGRVLSAAVATFRGVAVRIVKFDAGGGDIRSGPMYQAPGDDAAPLPGDYVYTGRSPRTGALQVLGTVDPVAQPDSPAGPIEAGGRRIYSRDAAGDIQAQVALLPNGTIDVSNTTGVRVTISAGAITLTTGGGEDMNLNGVIINSSGELTAAKVSAPSIEADGEEVTAHNHQFTNADGATDATAGLGETL